MKKLAFVLAVLLGVAMAKEKSVKNGSISEKNAFIHPGNSVEKLGKGVGGRKAALRRRERRDSTLGVGWEKMLQERQRFARL